MGPAALVGWPRGTCGKTAGDLGGCWEPGQAELQGCLCRGCLTCCSKWQPVVAALRRSLGLREQWGPHGEPVPCLHQQPVPVSVPITPPVPTAQHPAGEGGALHHLAAQVPSHGVLVGAWAWHTPRHNPPWVRRCRATGATSWPGPGAGTPRRDSDRLPGLGTPRHDGKWFLGLDAMRRQRPLLRGPAGLFPGQRGGAGRGCGGARAHPAVAAESPPPTNAPNPLARSEPGRSGQRLGALLHRNTLMGRVSLRLGSQSHQLPLPGAGHHGGFQLASLGGPTWPHVGKVLASSSPPGKPDTGLALG